MIELFYTIFYEPIFNLLIFIYNNLAIQDLGLSIIILTVVIKLILWPLTKKSIKSQKALQDIQPQIQKIKKEYGNKKEEMGKKMMELYKKNKVNPFSSCLPLLVQLPFLLAVFRVFRNGVSENLNLVYPFLTQPDTINNLFLGFLDLSEPSLYIALLAGIAQFFQTRMLSKKKPSVNTEGAKDENMMAIMNKQMMYIMPVLTVFIGSNLPGGLTLYWFVLTLLTVLQQFLVFKNKKQPQNQVVESESQEVKEN